RAGAAGQSGHPSRDAELGSRPHLPLAASAGDRRQLDGIGGTWMLTILALRHGEERMSALAHIAVIILAAGRSTRMGAGNKLLADVNGRPMIRHAVEAALASQGKPVLVVIGHQAGAVREALAGLPIGFVDNPCYAAGLSGSLRRGIDALPAGCEGALIVLGGMPPIARTPQDAPIPAV